MFEINFAVIAAAIALIIAFVVLTRRKGGGDEAPAPVDASPMNPRNWQIGPIVDGDNFSEGVPLHPQPVPGGWEIAIPYPTPVAGSVHYVTTPTGSLAGKSKITMNYRVEVSPGAKIVPRRFPELPSIISLHFQRKGDDWTASHEAYRWYASFAKQSPITPGEHTLEVRFDQNWSAVLTSTRENNPQAFEAALAGAERIGFVLGGGDGLGHGVYATGPARIVVTSFKVE